MKEEQIIEVSRKLFEKYGYKKVSMDEIAKEAGVTRKTLYSYFKNKEEILKYFLNEEIQNMKAIVEKNEKRKKSFFDALNKTIFELMEYTRNRNFLKIIIEESEAFKNPVIIENLKVIDITIQNYIKEKLDTAVKNKEIYVKDTEVMAFLIFKMYIALLLEWDDNQKSKMDEKQIADTIINLLKNGLNSKNKKWKGRGNWIKRRLLK